MTIYLTPTAQKKLESIWNYLKAEFGEKSAHTFREKTTKFLNTVSEFPEVGISEVPEKNIRSYLITSKTRVFYRIKGSRILILTFFDVRQHPLKKPR
jgi:plasmid stabilization system protein ParE